MRRPDPGSARCRPGGRRSHSGRAGRAGAEGSRPGRVVGPDRRVARRPPARPAAARSPRGPGECLPSPPRRWAGRTGRSRGRSRRSRSRPPSGRTRRPGRSGRRWRSGRRGGRPPRGPPGGHRRRSHPAAGAGPAESARVSRTNIRSGPYASTRPSGSRSTGTIPTPCLPVLSAMSCSAHEPKLAISGSATKVSLSRPATRVGDPRISPRLTPGVRLAGPWRGSGRASTGRWPGTGRGRSR